MAIHIGYTTKRGRIIRKILNRVSNYPDFFKTAIYFMLENLILGLTIYLSTLGLVLSVSIPSIFVVYRLFDMINYTIPPPIPIYFQLIYTMSLGRLRWKGISGTEP